MKNLTCICRLEKVCFERSVAALSGAYSIHKKIQIMRAQLNHQELVKKVTMYLDNELSEIDERDLLHEIKSNPDYLNVLSREKSFREFIKSKINRRKPSPALIQSIKEKIRVDPARP